MIRPTGTRSRRRARGQALVEFALALPLIVLAVLGLLDLGRGIFAYNTMSQSARQANRSAIVDQDTDRVKAVAVANAATLGLAPANVTVCFKTSNTTLRDCSNPTADNCPASSRVVGCLAIVRVQMAYAPLTPVISVFWSSISVSSTSAMPIEYVCPFGTQTTCP